MGARGHRRERPARTSSGLVWSERRRGLPRNRRRAREPMVDPRDVRCACDPRRACFRIACRRRAIPSGRGRLHARASACTATSVRIRMGPSISSGTLLPAKRVFVDGRNDTVYPPRVVRDYFLFHFDLAGGLTFWMPIRTILCLSLTAAPARHLMERRNDWKLLYRDNELAPLRTRERACGKPARPARDRRGASDGFP